MKSRLAYGLVLLAIAACLALALARPLLDFAGAGPLWQQRINITTTWFFYAMLGLIALLLAMAVAQRYGRRAKGAPPTRLAVRVPLRSQVFAVAGLIVLSVLSRLVVSILGLAPRGQQLIGGLMPFALGAAYLIWYWLRVRRIASEEAANDPKNIFS